MIDFKLNKLFYLTLSGFTMLITILVIITNQPTLYYVITVDRVSQPKTDWIHPKACRHYEDVRCVTYNTNNRLPCDIPAK